MQKLEFLIEGTKYAVSIDGSPEFKVGKNEFLSKENTDITFHQPWYPVGYTEQDFLNEEEFASLKQGLTLSISNMMKQELNIETEGFNLENYHEFVKSDTDHFKIVDKTRDLFADDFNFPIMTLIPRLGNILGFPLTDINNITKKKLHIIVRINRPNSKDFNPPHKDIYEGVDKDNYIPQFVNFWIPIAGVTENSSLPIAPKSHLLNENTVKRTFDGGVVEGNKYRVRMIESWNGDNALIRSTVKYGQVLIFSGHLIHGLAVNDEKDKTRVALEFRLFKAES